MIIDGLQIPEGSIVTNLTVASGANFPGSPSTGELFYMIREIVQYRG